MSHLTDFPSLVFGWLKVSGKFQSSGISVFLLWCMFYDFLYIFVYQSILSCYATLKVTTIVLLFCKTFVFSITSYVLSFEVN